MPSHHLNVPALYWALDKRRAAAGLTWKAVAVEMGISNSTFSRMADGRSPDADALCSMLVWLGLSLRQFVGQGEGPRPAGDPVPLAESERESPSVIGCASRGA